MRPLVASKFHPPCRPRRPRSPQDEDQSSARRRAAPGDERGLVYLQRLEGRWRARGARGARQRAPRGPRGARRGGRDRRQPRRPDAGSSGQGEAEHHPGRHTRPPQRDLDHGRGRLRRGPPRPRRTHPREPRPRRAPRGGSNCRSERARRGTGSPGRGQISGIRAGDTRSALFEVRAPMEGRVVEKHLTRGELVDPKDPLFTVADLRRVWIWVDIYERDLAWVRAGDAAEVRTDAFP
ncbi:MAG: HlyD family efflux transporter periplasmic adaptor subunit [Myxococcales bacterium]|nr:HlyD family efflux transporter periplasmic adaptor subunit [Myxococcales bacterium]